MKKMNKLPNKEWFIELSQKFQIPLDEIENLYKFMDCDASQLINYLNSFEIDKFSNRLPKISIYNNGILIKDRFYDFSIEKNRELFKMLQNNEFDKEVFEEVFGSKNSKEEDILIERVNEFYHPTLDLSDLKRNIECANENSKRIKRSNCSESPHLTYKFVLGKGKVLKEALDDTLKNDLSYENPIQINCKNSSVLDSPLNESVSCPSISNEHIELENDSRLPESITIGDEPFIKFKVVHRNKETLVLSNPRFKISDILLYIRSILRSNVSILLNGEVLDENESVIILKYTLSDII